MYEWNVATQDIFLILEYNAREAIFSEQERFRQLIYKVHYRLKKLQYVQLQVGEHPPYPALFIGSLVYAIWVDLHQ